MYNLYFHLISDWKLLHQQVHNPNNRPMGLYALLT